MSLGIGASLGKTGLVTPGIVTDNLVMKHNYAAGSVVPVSDGAAYFNGTNAAITTGAKPVDTADATYCFWANSSASGENRGTFSHGNDDNGSFSMNHHLNRPLIYLDGNLFQYWAAQTSLSSDGLWHHWAVVVDVSDMTACKLYIDGTEIEQDSARSETYAHINTYGNIQFGKNNSNFYEGYLCNFGVWAGLLDQPEIKSIMNKSYAELSSDEKSYKGGLQAWWNLDEETNTDGTDGIGGVKDSHGSNHGELV